MSAASCLGTVIPQEPQECCAGKGDRASLGRVSQRRAGGTNKHFMSAPCVSLTLQRPCKNPAISFSGWSMLNHLQDFLQLMQLVDGRAKLSTTTNPSLHPPPPPEGPEHQWEGWAAVFPRTPFLDSQPLSTPKHPSAGERGQDQERRYHVPLGLERKM